MNTCLRELENDGHTYCLYSGEVSKILTEDQAFISELSNNLAIGASEGPCIVVCSIRILVDANAQLGKTISVADYCAES